MFNVTNTPLPVTITKSTRPSGSDHSSLLDDCHETVSTCSAKCAEEETAPWANSCAVYDDGKASLCGCLTKEQYDAQPKFIRRYDLDYYCHQKNLNEQTGSNTWGPCNYWSDPVTNETHVSAMTVLMHDYTFRGLVSHDYSQEERKIIQVDGQCEEAKTECRYWCEDRDMKTSFTCQPRSLILTPMMLEPDFKLIDSKCSCVSSHATAIEDFADKIGVTLSFSVSIVMAFFLVAMMFVIARASRRTATAAPTRSLKV